jgi:hypothetical protein
VPWQRTTEEMNAQATSDAELAGYRRAIELHAEDIDRKWS